VKDHEGGQQAERRTSELVEGNDVDKNRGTRNSGKEAWARVRDAGGNPRRAGYFTAPPDLSLLRAQVLPRLTETHLRARSRQRLIPPHFCSPQPGGFPLGLSACEHHETSTAVLVTNRVQPRLCTMYLSARTYRSPLSNLPSLASLAPSRLRLPSFTGILGLPLDPSPWPSTCLRFRMLSA
jgi:hypothetical protein